MRTNNKTSATNVLGPHILALFMVLCGTALSAASNAQMLAPMGEIPIGQPTAPAGAASTERASPLKYRSTDIPLTIGEMSDMAAAKAQADFLKTHGFTQDAPPKPAVVPRAVAVVPKEPVYFRFRPLAVWGVGSQLNAEANVNGMVRNIRAGDVLHSGIVVKSIGPHSITLDVSLKVVAKASDKEPKQKGAAKSEIEVMERTVPVGQTTQVPLS